MPGGCVVERLRPLFIRDPSPYLSHDFAGSPQPRRLLRNTNQHKSADLEEAGILETDYDTHRRVGDGISGGAFPPSWEVIDSELYAIYAYLRRRVEVMEATGATQRCLVLCTIRL